MERRHKFLALFCGFAFLAAFGFIFPKTTVPSAHAASAQTIPAISVTNSARDAGTFQLDKALDAACRKSGQTGPVCICVTHVMKYELSLEEYKVASRIYGQRKNRSTLRTQLYTEGYQKTAIDTAAEMEDRLIQSSDFAARCANAKAYYKTTQR